MTHVVCSECRGQIAWTAPRIVVQTWVGDRCGETVTVHPKCLHPHLHERRDMWITPPTHSNGTPDAGRW